MSADQRKSAPHHKYSVENMRKPIEKGVFKSSVVDLAVKLDHTNEQLDALVKDAQPGNRLMDLYPNNISFQGLTSRANPHQLDVMGDTPWNARDMVECLRG